MTTGLRALLAAAILWILPTADAAAGWDLDALGRVLGQGTEGRVAFREERTLSYLDAPLRSSGFLVRHGARLEKHVTEPTTETFIIDGTEATIRTAGGEDVTFALLDHPLLWGTATALRAALAGETSALQRTFDVSLEGEAEGWLLRLFPQSDALRDELREIAISGRGGQVTSIHMIGAYGDSSLMTLEHPTP